MFNLRARSNRADGYIGVEGNVVAPPVFQTGDSEFDPHLPYQNLFRQGDEPFIRVQQKPRPWEWTLAVRRKPMSMVSSETVRRALEMRRVSQPRGFDSFTHRVCSNLRQQPY